MRFDWRLTDLQACCCHAAVRFQRGILSTSGPATWCWWSRAVSRQHVLQRGQHSRLGSVRRASTRSNCMWIAHSAHPHRWSNVSDVGNAYPNYPNAANAAVFGVPSLGPVRGSRHQIRTVDLEGRSGRGGRFSTSRFPNAYIFRPSEHQPERRLATFSQPIVLVEKRYRRGQGYDIRLEWRTEARLCHHPNQHGRRPAHRRLQRCHRSGPPETTVTVVWFAVRVSQQVNSELRLNKPAPQLSGTENSVGPWRYPARWTRRDSFPQIRTVDANAVGELPGEDLLWLSIDFPGQNW